MTDGIDDWGLGSVEHHHGPLGRPATPAWRGILDIAVLKHEPVAGQWPLAVSNALELHTKLARRVLGANSDLQLVHPHTKTSLAAVRPGNLACRLLPEKK